MTHLIKLASKKAKRDSDEAKLVRDDLLETCAAAANSMGDGLAGYALVVWDKTGGMRTSYNAAQGPVSPALVPTLAADALNRHVAVMLARHDAPDDTEAS
jgi:hypothetical protein